MSTPLTPDPENQTPPQEPAGPSRSRPPRISSGTWVFVFLAVLVGFNLFLFLGSQEIWSRLVNVRRPMPGESPTWRIWETRHDLEPPPPPGPGPQPTPSVPEGLAHAPGPGDAPPPAHGGGPADAPPPPPQGGGPGETSLAGPELVLALVALKQNPEVGLTAEQSSRCAALLVDLEEPQTAMLEHTASALRCLSTQQVAWIRANRGEAQVDSSEPVEPGMDPVASAVKRLLTARAAKASGKPEQADHEARDLQLHDLLNGILRLEKASGGLAISPVQAQALLPLLAQASASRKKEIVLYEQLYRILGQEQVDWIRKHPEDSRMDVNRVILRYGQLVLKQ